MAQIVKNRTVLTEGTMHPLHSQKIGYVVTVRSEPATYDDKGLRIVRNKTAVDISLNMSDEEARMLAEFILQTLPSPHE